MRNVFRAVGLFCLVAILASGCGRKKETASAVSRPKPAVKVPVTPPPDDNAPPPPGGAPAAAKQPDATPEENKDNLDRLKIVLGSFEAELQRRPASIDDLVLKGFTDRIPAAPEGKKYVYDAAQNTVLLADKQPGEADPQPPTREQLQEAMLQTAREIHEIQRRTAVGGKPPVEAVDPVQRTMDNLMITVGSFRAELQRQPVDINELVTSGYLPALPAAPEGKKFFLDNAKGKVVLVDRLPDEKDPTPLTPEQLQEAQIKSAKEFQERQKHPAPEGLVKGGSVPKGAVDPVQQVIDNLTITMGSFRAELQRSPANLHEIVEKGFMTSIPAAPEGKKFEIDPKTQKIVLMDMAKDEKPPESMTPQQMQEAQLATAKEIQALQRRTALGLGPAPVPHGEVDPVQQTMDNLMITVGSFRAELQRQPASLDELVSRGYLTALPKAPEGKKFVLDAERNKIVLADRRPDEKDPAPLSAEALREAQIKSALEFQESQRKAGSNARN